MKNKLISLILILALLAITAPTSVYGAGSVTLDPLSDATAGDTITVKGTTSTLSEVTVKVVHPNTTIVYLGVATVSGGAFSLQIKLPESLTAGTYTVVAGNGTVNATKTLSVTALPPIQLSKPDKPSLADKKAAWTAVTNENNGYSLQLYKGGSAFGSAVTIAHGAAFTYDFSTVMTTAGSYTVTVTARGSGRYADSIASDPSDPQVVEAIAVTGVTLNKSSITISKGSAETLIAAVQPADAANTNVIWSSNNTTVAAVSSTGKVTGVAAGTAIITVTTADGGKTAACQVTVTQTPTNTGGSGGGGGSTVTPPPDDSAKVTGTDPTGKPIQETALPVTVDQNAGRAAVDIGSQQGDIVKGGGTAVITIPRISGMDIYTMGIPVAYLTTPDGKGSLAFNTDTGSVTLPADMLEGVAGAEGKKAEISISQGDKSSLPEAAKAAVGDRPLVQLTLTLDGMQTEWNNPGAPVTVSIPYTPTAAELENPESIVAWYIDGSGNPICVPNGHYDPANGTVTFSTTHFSDYAVGYNKMSFNDVAASAWYSKAVDFIAARGITTGTGSGNYSPKAELTRGEFLVMLMKAYNIAPDANPKDNFADAGSTYYTGYMSAAKRLSISGGVGNNMFAPDKEITRQEMFTLLYNALKEIGQLPESAAVKPLSDFSDGDRIASWAKDAMHLFVQTGTISGSNGSLSPASTTKRAEMAQVIYNLLSK